MTLQLRPYQTEAITKLRQAMASGKRRVLLYSPTGSGKTVTAEALIRAFLEKSEHGQVLFCANRRQLVAQASSHLTRAGIAHGIVQAANTARLHERVLVCSIDSLHTRGLPDDVRLIVIDEAHWVAGSAKYLGLLTKLNAVPVVGLSATPFNPGLGATVEALRGPLFEALVPAVTIRELIEQGYLCDVDVFAPADPNLTGIKARTGVNGDVDYVGEELAERMNQPQLVGDIVSHWLALAAGKQTVVFASNIAHSQSIVSAFQAAGVTACHIDYHADDDERNRILTAFAQGEYRVLSNAGLLSEGWDCPATECMILARPTQSLTRYIQMVGRVLRPAPGKTRALLLDHSGSVLKLGFATDDLPLSLDEGKAGKSASKKQERQPSQPKACTKCKFVRPAGVHICPSCGFAPQRQSDVVTLPGELVKLGKSKKPIRGKNKQHIYSQLLNIQRERGYQHGWAAHKYRAMFGAWPRGLREVGAEPTDELRKWVISQQIRSAKSHKGGAHAN